jgi:hypothetical protein
MEEKKVDGGKKGGWRKEEEGPLEGVGLETNVHKITNVLAFLIWLLDLMILMQATYIIWAQMALASLVVISGPEKVSIFRAHPFQCPS